MQSRECKPDKLLKFTWRVEEIGDDGECYVSLFTGPQAGERAQEYFEFLRAVEWRGAHRADSPKPTSAASHSTERRVQAQKAETVDSKKELFNLADAVHTLLCHENHTDCCDYYYYSWTAPKEGMIPYGYARERALTNAAVVAKWAKSKDLESESLVDLFKELKR